MNLRYLVRQCRHKAKRLVFSSKHDCSEPSIIITGNQKSGTSAIASLLAEAVGQKATIDVFFRMGQKYSIKVMKREVSFKDFTKAARLYFSKPIVKDPDFIFYLPELISLYPNSTFIVIVRDPKDNIRSILNRLSSARGSEEVTIDDIKRTAFEAPLWGLMFNNSLMPYEVDGLIKTLAFRWKFTFSVVERFSDQVFVVPYEDFRKDKARYIHHLTKELGLSQVRSIEHLVEKQYQPKGHSNMKSFFSEKHERQIEEICGNYCDLLGSLTKVVKQSNSHISSQHKQPTNKSR